VLVSLGVWQLHRLDWKRELIQRVDARVHARPVAEPGPTRWPFVSPDQHEYLRVRMQGHYLNDHETLVQAVTRLGPGFWVMTPFETVEGYVVLVNRGFVPSAQRDAATRLQGQIEGETTVIGLLRMTEVKGGFLRDNDSSNDRWYSRDVAAISVARGVTNSAPYFIDADAIEPALIGAPVGGLTVIAFTNNHLQYAFTWFALALMLAGGTLVELRHEWYLRRSQATSPIGQESHSSRSTSPHAC